MLEFGDKAEFELKFLNKPEFDIAILDELEFLEELQSLNKKSLSQYFWMSLI